MEAKQKLIAIKALFAEFKTIAEQINDLCDSNNHPNGTNGPPEVDLYNSPGNSTVVGSLHVPYYSNFDLNGSYEPQQVHLSGASGNASVGGSFNLQCNSNVDPNGGNERVHLNDAPGNVSVCGYLNVPYYSNFDPNGGYGSQEVHLYGVSGNTSASGSFNVPYDLNAELSFGKVLQEVNLSPGNDSAGGSLHVMETLTTNKVFGVDLPMETTFNSHLDAILNEEESNTTLRNYFFYLYDNNDVPHNLSPDPNGGYGPQNVNFNYSSDSSSVCVPHNLSPDPNGGYGPQNVNFNYSSDSSSVCVSRNLSPDPNGGYEPHNVNFNSSSDSSSVCIINERNVEVSHDSILQQDVNDLDHFLDVENIAEKAKPLSSGRLPKQIAEMQSPFQLCVKSKQVRGCDNSDMYVEASNTGVKKQCCPFCGKLISKLPRHMEDIHGSELDVQEFLKHPKNSAERKAILDDLRKTGNFDHNRIAELNKKLYIPIRRPNVNHKREAFQHTPCPYCKGAYTSTALRLHIKYHCKKKPKVNEEKSKVGRVEQVTRKLATAVDGRIHESASIKLEQLLQTKRGEDNVLRLIRFDWLLVLYGNKLCKKYTRLKNKAMIRSRLRLGGRILIAVKSIQPQITDFASLYHAEFYDFVVEAIEIVARHNAEQEEFDFPGTASKCITGIREIAAILKAAYIKRDNDKKLLTTKKFMTVFNTEISTDICKAVAETQVRRKIEKQVIVPSLDDVSILARHIDVKHKEFFEKLSMSFSYENWVRLAEAIVGSIIVFNRKRIGDVEDILVGDFERKESIKESSSDPLYQNLSEEEKKVARQYSRMKVRGKLGHPVFVMLKSEIEKSIELLLSHRQDACIPTKNKFLFALPSSLDEIVVMNAYTILKKFALSCDAKDPSKLNGTLLRKHLATHCASLELNDSRVADVAKFLGHSETVHRQIYRQNTVERQFVHLPQVLEASLGNAAVLTFPNQMKTKPMIRDTDLERKRSSTSRPKSKCQSIQKEKNDIKKTVNKRTNKRKLRGSYNLAARSNENLDLKKSN